MQARDCSSKASYASRLGSHALDTRLFNQERSGDQVAFGGHMHHKPRGIELGKCGNAAYWG